MLTMGIDVPSLSFSSGIGVWMFAIFEGEVLIARVEGA